MGNWNCCNCIEKKETQINQISNIRHTQNNIKKNGIIPIKTIEFSKLKDNKESKYEEKLSFYSLDEDDKNITKRTNKTNSNSNRFNETTHSYTTSKDISFKYINNNENKNCQDKTNEKNNKIEKLENKNKNEDIEEKKNQVINPYYYHTDCKKSKFNIYFNCFDNKKIDGNNNQELSLNYSNCFPLKYNYRKDKYISYFTDENI